jgi:hypothetical protein
MTHYIFCFPYRGVGGVPILFQRMADLVTRRGHKASVVDYADGAMAKASRGTAIDVIPYEDDGRAAIPGDAILVFQSLNPWAMYRGLRPADDTRLFFWNCHPFNLVPVFPGLRSLMMSRPALGRFFLATLLRRYRTIVRRFIAFLLARRALVFMDRTNLQNTSDYLGIMLPQRDYLPVPAGQPAAPVDRTDRDWFRQGLRLAWIGRIADFKYPILSYTLKKLDQICPALGVPLHVVIIGGGEHAGDLAADIGKLRNLRVEMRGELAVEEIEPFLRNEVDVLLGMGSSILEGARLGLPSLLLDIFYGPVPAGYVFDWLSSREGFVLGDIVPRDQFRPGNQSLLERLREVIADFPAVSGEAKRYYDMAHAPEAVCDRFLAASELSHCFYRDFKSAGFSAGDPVYDRFAALRKRFTR